MIVETFQTKHVRFVTGELADQRGEDDEGRQRHDGGVAEGFAAFEMKTPAPAKSPMSSALR